MEKVCRITDIPKAAMKGFTVKDKQILLANVNGTIYAVDALCPHMNGYLPSGRLEDNEVVCPVHHARYDVTTGKMVRNVDALVRIATGHGGKDLHTYVIKLQADDILIDI